MNLCNDGHEEVCYESRNCPACIMKDERDGYEKDIEQAQDTISELKAEVNELEDKVKGLVRQLGD